MDEETLRKKITRTQQAITWRWMMFGGSLIIGYTPAKTLLSGTVPEGGASSNVANIFTVVIALIAAGYFLYTNLKEVKKKEALEAQLEEISPSVAGPEESSE